MEEIIDYDELARGLDQYSWEDDPPSYDLERLVARGMNIPEEPQ